MSSESRFPDEEDAFKYSLEWFKYHAGQRYESFRLFVFQLFLVPLGAIGTLVAKPDADANPYFWSALCALLIFGAWMSFLFFRLDRRNRHLVRLGENMLKEFEPRLFPEIVDMKVKTRGILVVDDSEHPTQEWYNSHSKIFEMIFFTSMAVFGASAAGALVWAAYLFQDP